MKSNLYINEIRIDKEIPRDNYLRKLPVVRNLRRMGGLQFHKNVTFLVGENGVGKSTLIEGIAVADASDVPDGVHAGIGKTGFTVYHIHPFAHPHDLSGRGGDGNN